MGIIETHSLTKSFGGLTAVDDVDLSVSSEEVKGIIGPNGSGKTTLFNLISGVLKPDGGSIYFNDEEITGSPTNAIARKGIGRTFQIPRPIRRLTVLENMLVVKNKKGDKKSKASQILNLLEIGHLSDTYADELSVGQKKLLELARVLMLEPSVLMLDEPTAGVNPTLQSKIINFLEELNQDGATIVVIEHDMSVIKSIADKVIVLNKGELWAEGTYNEVRSDPAVKEAYLGG